MLPTRKMILRRIQISLVGRPTKSSAVFQMFIFISFHCRGFSLKAQKNTKQKKHKKKPTCLRSPVDGDDGEMCGM